MKGPTPRSLLRQVRRHLRLESYLKAPGDRRSQPQIHARTLWWSLLLGRVMREPSRSLPFDVEPFGPGDSEYSTAQHLLSEI